MRGINLAADLPENPFLEAFKRVDEAVAAKQEYETRQVKQLFHGDEGRLDMELMVALTEKARAPSEPDSGGLPTGRPYDSDRGGLKRRRHRV